MNLNNSYNKTTNKLVKRICLEKGVWLVATTRQSKCNWSAADKIWSLALCLFKKQNAKPVSFVVLWLFYTMSVSQLILDFSLNSLKCSVWLKQREKAVIMITLSLHPLACARLCFQMANFCLFPYAACCNSACCWPPGTRCAVRPFCCRGSCEPSGTAHTYCAQCSPTLCLWWCLHDSGAPLVMVYCTLCSNFISCK